MPLRREFFTRKSVILSAAARVLCERRSRRTPKVSCRRYDTNPFSHYCWGEVASILLDGTREAAFFGGLRLTWDQDSEKPLGYVDYPL
jgi:hypothetical protein